MQTGQAGHVTPAATQAAPIAAAASSRSASSVPWQSQTAWQSHEDDFACGCGGGATLVGSGAGFEPPHAVASKMIRTARMGELYSLGQIGTVAVPALVRRPFAAAQALGVAPCSIAGGADAARVERVPRVRPLDRV